MRRRARHSRSAKTASEQPPESRTPERRLSGLPSYSYAADAAEEAATVALVAKAEAVEAVKTHLNETGEALIASKTALTEAEKDQKTANAELETASVNEEKLESCLNATLMNQRWCGMWDRYVSILLHC